MPTPGARAAALLAAVTGCLSLLVLPTASAAPAARHSIAVPHAKARLSSAIEPIAPYEPQTDCGSTVHPGTQRLMALLLHTYPDGTNMGMLQSCAAEGMTSEHSDGRALDFGLSVSNRHQHAEALKLLHWLFATDKAGNTDAMARRLGVMYVIYAGRIRMAGGDWRPYDQGYCWTASGHPAGDPTTCHRNHIHISLDWNGAMGRTSFWTGRVTRTDYGPCVSWGHIYSAAYHRPNYEPCPAEQPTRPEPTIAAGSTGVYDAALQQALGVHVTGTFTHSLTRTLKRWQRAHHLTATGVAGSSTWAVINAMPRMH